MIFIFCPRGNATGGTELLHQLGYKLNLFGFEVCMYYYGDDNGLPVLHPRFKGYGVPIAESVSDQADNVFIYPEMMVSSLIDIKRQLPLSKHVLWWLSVDNAGMTPELIKIVSDEKDLIHFVQSYYALDYVKSVLLVPDERLYYLSDYLNTDFLNIHSDDKRDDIVLFNPRKGFERTSGLIRYSDYRIKWQALEGLAPEDIPMVLKKAKVYIDFGNHPGKDRFPREAVSCGCRIITGRRGAAANDKDIPIPEELKVSDDAADDKILDLICALLQNYDKTEELYTEYKNKISEEFHSFEADVLSVFNEITEKTEHDTDRSEKDLREDLLDAVTKEDYRRSLYLITIYRIKKYVIDEVIMILEGYTRLGLGEDQTAVYIMNKLLDMNPKNYEAYLIKARALSGLDMEGASEAIDNAVSFSKGTEDEEYIKESINALGFK
ncbi:MAG: hypothetical protein K6E49_00370 [Lachnospiraceae bacterium]|nr:hypothetical protein [Lachnospiraceae bacterium]